MSARPKQVFLNVPFDLQFTKLLDGLVFAVQACGLRPRCALEAESATQGRLEKIFDLIAECDYGIHDLSRTTLDRHHRLPRFNMPLELGIFLGAQKFGGPAFNDKKCLILERDEHRYDVFCSDLSGRDISAHGNRADRAVRAVQTWLESYKRGIPSAHQLASLYLEFRRDVDNWARREGYAFGSMSFLTRRDFASEWLASR